MFLYMCNADYSVLLLWISLYIYVYICINTPGHAYIYIYMHIQYINTPGHAYIYIYSPCLFRHLRKTITQHERVCDSVTVYFIPLWKLSFLHMC